VSRPPSRRSALELLDSPASITAEIAENLADIRRLNLWFGGTSLAIRCLQPMLVGRQAITLLDVATGSGDVPLAQLNWAEHAGLQLRVTASDISPEVLSEASGHIRRADVRLCIADARRLPWPDRSFDVVQSCLALHHLGPADARIAIAEMWRVARVGIVITDLYRSRTAYLATWLVTRLAARSRVTRHDGPLSVLRAYTPSELEALAEQAVIPGANVRRHLFFRQSLIAIKAAA
jgi:ubiquinone/menaquinone biosynthesis C-methylase UbiE